MTRWDPVSSGTIGFHEPADAAVLWMNRSTGESRGPFLHTWTSPSSRGRVDSSACDSLLETVIRALSPLVCAVAWTNVPVGRRAQHGGTRSGVSEQDDGVLWDIACPKQPRCVPGITMANAN